MSGMEFSDADLLPGEKMSGATEWDDALIKHGIKEAQVVQATDDDLHQEGVARHLASDPHANKSLAELDTLEDELEDNVIAHYRARRIEQMKAKAKLEIYGQVYHIREQDFIQEVSQAPADTYVVLHLFAATEPECQILDKFMGQVAAKHRAVKFCKIRAQEAIHNFPSHKCPTILIYKNTHIIKQIEKLGAFGGSKISALTIEWVLAQPVTIRPAGSDADVTHQILTTELTSNPANAANKLSRQQKGGRRDDSDEDDSDSDY
jgi:hypothetical protein